MAVLPEEYLDRVVEYCIIKVLKVVVRMVSR